MDEQYRITKEDEIFLNLKAIITAIIGTDKAEIIGIRWDSKFLLDLMIDSIKIASFAERVQDTYGDRVDFAAWITQIPVRKWKNITVGDIAALIAQNLD